VKAMRGRDFADLRKALEGRGGEDSPFDIDLADAGGLERTMAYWPGTPFLSHA